MKWLLAFLIVSVQWTVSEALTLSDLLTETRIFLRDSAADPTRQRFSDTQLTSFLNEAQRDFNFKTWAVITSSAFSLTPGTTEYSLPPLTLTPLRVTVNFTAIPERTFSFLDDSQTDWVRSSGTPTAYYIRVDSSIVDGVSRLSIGFTPVSTFTALAIVQYLSRTTDLALSADVPFGSDNLRFFEFHHALAYYAAWLGYMILSMDNDSLFFRKYYDDTAAQAEAVTKNRLSYNPNFRSGFPLMPAGGNIKGATQ